MIWQQQAWKPGEKKNTKLLYIRAPVICIFWFAMFMFEKFFVAGANIARITVIKFPILNTQDEKYTADSPRIRPYSNKILSNFAQWFTFCSQMMMLLIQKYIIF